MYNTHQGRKYLQSQCQFLKTVESVESPSRDTSHRQIPTASVKGVFLWRLDCMELQLIWPLWGHENMTVSSWTILPAHVWQNLFIELVWLPQPSPPRRSRSRSHSPSRRRSHRDYDRSRRHSRSPGHHRLVDRLMLHISFLVNK